MARLFLLLFVIQIALAVIALIGCLSADDDDIRGLPRIGWILVILFFPLVGSIAWFIAGRPRTKSRPGGWRPGVGFPERERRTVAPDDDPEFLRKLGEEKSRGDDELFQKWEEDLRRREDELRKRKDDDRPEDRSP